jgi:predicted transcriptional regulator
MKYRSRTEITAMILDTANMETTKTKIMYNAYLSYNQLKEYISILIENNLLEYLEGARAFRTTEKGLNFLKMYREMTKLLQTTTIIKNDNEFNIF